MERSCGRNACECGHHLTADTQQQLLDWNTTSHSVTKPTVIGPVHAAQQRKVNAGRGFVQSLMHPSSTTERSCPGLIHANTGETHTMLLVQRISFVVPMLFLGFVSCTVVQNPPRSTVVTPAPSATTTYVTPAPSYVTPVPEYVTPGPSATVVAP